ncbi:MAG TPA: HAD family hydrolase [Chthoniobacterales bacterium]|nr:HAD family hydrolase [Chthoniobacterales bacterium]
MIRAVIFDLDGTLVDSNDLHAEAWQETFRRYGKEIPYADLRRQIGKGGDQYLPVFLDPREMQEMGPEVEKFRADLFKRKYLARVKPFPRVHELFQLLRDKGKRLALGSSGNSDEVTHYAELAKISELFETQTTKTDVDHSKPRPDVFLSALRLLGTPADETIVVGDTPYDVEAAKKASLQTIGLRCGGFPEDELRASGAIAIYDDPADLLESYHRSPLA